MNNQFQIRVHSGGLRGQAFVVDKPEFKIGRDPSCDIALTETAVSRVHAIIFNQGVNTLVLADNNSTNGTTINNLQVTSPVQISENDVIMLGGEVALAVERVPAGVNAGVDGGQQAQPQPMNDNAGAAPVPPFAAPYDPNQPQHGQPAPDPLAAQGANYPFVQPPLGAYPNPSAPNYHPGMNPANPYGQAPYGQPPASAYPYAQPAANPYGAPSAPAGYPQPQPEPAPQGMNPDTVQPSLQEPQGMPGMSAFPAQEAFMSGTSAPNGGADPMNPMGAPAMAPFSQSAYPQPQPVSQYSGYQANLSQSLDPMNPYGQPQQPGLDPNNPYGQPQQNPSGSAQPGIANPYAQPQAPQGFDPNNPYSQQNPYAQAQPGIANPYAQPQAPQGFDPNNPYSQQNPYAQAQPGMANPYVQPQAPQGFDPNNPYAQPQAAYGYGQQPNPYGQNPYGQQPGYGYADPNYNPVGDEQCADGLKSKKTLFIILGIVLAVILIIVALIVYVDANYLWCDWFSFLWSAEACQNYPPAVH